MRQLLVAAEDLQAGDKLENGATILRSRVGADPMYVVYEYVGGGARTAYRYKKFTIERI